MERARRETVRALKAAVGEQCAGRESDEDERWTRLRTEVSADIRPIIDDAMALAGTLLGATAPRWQRLEALCEEYLGTAGPPESPCAADPPLSNRELLEPAREWLEKESAQWAFLDEPGAVEAPSIDSGVDPRCLDAELQRLAELRERWDEVFGHVAMLFRAADGWRRAGFASFEHYCTERLGMAERAVAQRIALERRLYELPALREAMREGRLAYEKARLIARHAGDHSVRDWIARAERMTCIEVRRALEAAEEAQMCARGEFGVHMPRRLLALVAAAFRLARRATGRCLSCGECLGIIAEHFIEVWKPAVVERSTVQKEVLARDRGLCRVPGCAGRRRTCIMFAIGRPAGRMIRRISSASARRTTCTVSTWVTSASAEGRRRRCSGS